MKRFIFMVIALMMTLSVATATETTKKETTNITKVFETDIHCEKCQAKVMKVIPYQKGVKDIAIDMRTKKITVKFDEKKTSEAKIVGSLKKLDINVLNKTK